jgi:transposase
MEPWVREWLETQRSEGEKCLEIKQRGKKYYVYYSTSHWDRERHKPIKTSKYRGILDRELGFIESKKTKAARSKDMPLPEVRSVTEYGNAALLCEAMKDILPLLKEGFPEDWEEIYALSTLRVAGNVPLKRAESLWQKLHNVDSIEPDLTPNNLSKMLHIVGTNREGQRVIFKNLLDQNQQLVYDLSCMFSRSMSISQAEKGFNKDKIHVPQINIALLCSADSGLPTMIRSLPGSVKDIATLCNSICELDIHDKLLILDRGFFSEDVFAFLDGRKISYLIPARRNSHYYNTRIHLNGHFRYHDRLIKCGSRKVGDKYLYLFEDQVLLFEEQNTLYERLDREEITKNKLQDEMKTAGRILILSNQEMSEQGAYELYKKRETVEKRFDTYKSTLSADRLYLQDDESVFGHVFIAFLSLYAYCKLELLLKKAKLNKRMTPIDLLFEFSKVYYIEFGENGSVMEVPKRIRDIEAKLGLNLFPMQES